MTSRSKLEASLTSDGADRFAEIESAGIADAFERFAEAVPSLLQFQSALFTGLVSANQREAARLAAIDEQSLDAVAAGSRAEKFYRMHAAATGIGSSIGKLVDGQLRAGLFHGFVLTDGGGQAAGYVVTIEVSESKALRAKTDDGGYFRIELAVPTRGKTAAGPSAGRKTARAADFDSLGRSDKDRAVLITIADPSKRVVLKEEVHLAGEDGEANTRIFSVPESGMRKGTSNKRSRA